VFRQPDYPLGGLLDGNHGPDALILKVRGVIEFAGIRHFRRRQQATDDFHLVADVHSLEVSLDCHLRQPRNRPPIVLLLQPLSAKDDTGGIQTLETAERVVMDLPNDARLALQHAAQQDRPRLRRGEMSDIIFRVNFAEVMMIRGGERGHTDPQVDKGETSLPASGWQRPAEKRGGGR